MCTTRYPSRFPQPLLKGSTPPVLGDNSTTVPPGDRRGELPSWQRRIPYRASGRVSSPGSSHLGTFPFRFFFFLWAFSCAPQGSFTSSFCYICGQTNGFNWDQWEGALLFSNQGAIGTILSSQQKLDQIKTWPHPLLKLSKQLRNSVQIFPKSPSTCSSLPNCFSSNSNIQNEKFHLFLFNTIIFLF